MATLLDGKAIRDEISKRLESRVKGLDPKPKLVIVQIGDNPESNTYIGQKVKFGEKIGAIVEHKKFPENVTQEELIHELSAMNHEPKINGVIIQLPIPKSLDKDAILESIDPKKDVDGMTSTNVKLLFEGPKPVILGSEATPESDSGQARMTSFTGYLPATTRGVLTMLSHYKIPIAGRHVVVIGRSTLVGKPTALALLNRDATVTVCHSKTENLPAITQTADIIISAVGSPSLITKEHVKEGQTVIDVGTTVVDGKLKGDVNFSEVEPIVEFISPVPGGAGPLTVASLFQNLLQAYQGQSNTE